MKLGEFLEDFKQTVEMAVQGDDHLVADDLQAIEDLFDHFMDQVTDRII